MEKWETVLYEREGPVAWITLNRPEVLNALNARLEAELKQALAEAEADPDVRVIVLRGAGRSFSAGYDLKETAASPVRGVVAWRRRLLDHLELTGAIWDCPKPVISAVHGHALGGGCDLALVCDLTVAGESARFGEPEVRFGSGVVTLVLPWVVGMKAARELLYTGDQIDARRALDLGLVNRVVPDDRLNDEACRLALRLATVDADTARLTKSALNRSYEIMGFRQALLHNVEVSAQIEAAESPERQEFDRLRREKGLKAAIAWRDSRFGGGTGDPA